jgi:hypothetical protein
VADFCKDGNEIIISSHVCIFQAAVFFSKGVSLFTKQNDVRARATVIWASDGLL